MPLGLRNDIVRGGVPSEFTIDSLSSAIHWYKFNEGITPNSGNPAKVEQWDDQIGGNHLKQAIESRQPNITVGGELDFTSTTAALISDNQVELTSFTICMVLEFQNNPNTDTIIGHRNQTLQLIRIGQGNTRTVRIQITDGSTVSANISAATDYPSAGTKYLFTITRDTTLGSNNINIYVDDSLKSQGTLGGNSLVFDINEIGVHDLQANSFDGDISEYIIFNEVLSDNDRALVQADVMARNSIS